MSSYKPPSTATAAIIQQLITNASQMSTRGRGLLACDDALVSIGKKFETIQMENTAANRRRYRGMLLSTPTINEYLNGVIFNQEMLDDPSLVALIRNQGILVGIKVDQGVQPLPLPTAAKSGETGETYTQGFTNLDGRCKAAFAKGARFAKWRAMYTIDGGSMSALSIHENAHALGKYAAICQSNGLVPIVEPDLVLSGDYSAECNQHYARKILTAIYQSLADFDVCLEGTLLKPSMTLAGHGYGNGTHSRLDYECNAGFTVDTLRRCVPIAVPGIMFLSGGQTEREATMNLNAVNALYARKYGRTPWTISFCFGRALQASCILAWNGSDSNAKQAQQEFVQRLQANCSAQLGKCKL